MDSDVSRFLRSWSDQLHCSANQVRDLIGGRHWLSDGRHKERLLGSFLREHLPEACDISNGFVFPILNPNNVSREIDILITDKRLAAPLLKSGDLVITSSFGLVAHVHVKSDLTRNSFDDAIATAVSVTKAVPVGGGRTPIAALFFFEQRNIVRPQFFHAFKPRLAELLDAKRSSGFVMCAGKNLFGVGKPAINGNRARLVLFELEKLAAGAFLANLLNGIETYLQGASSRPELLQAVADISPPPVATIEL